MLGPRRSIVLLVSLLTMASCGPTTVAPKAASSCAGEAEPPSIQLHGGLPMTAGGAHSWIEISASRRMGNPEVLLDEVPVPIVRVRDGRGDDGDGHALDATAGQLTPRASRAAASPGAAHVIGFRIPPGTSPGKHAITLRSCGTSSTETVGYEVLTGSAPEITSVRLVRGEVWHSLLIKGTGLASAEEVFLVSTDRGSTDKGVSSTTNLTRIDDGQLRVPVEKSGSYEVYVRGAHGLGGGPPNGSVIVR